jgi:hypothetical protein
MVADGVGVLPDGSVAVGAGSVAVAVGGESVAVAVGCGGFVAIGSGVTLGGAVGVAVVMHKVLAKGEVAPCASVADAVAQNSPADATCIGMTKVPSAAALPLANG